MRFFNVLGIWFYATVLILIGSCLIVFSFNILPPDDLNFFLQAVSENMNYRIIIGLSGLLLILISFSFAQLILGRFQSEKTIAFKIASGAMVTVGLSAIEDLIKHAAVILPEVREVRSDVVASKKGLVVNLKVVMKSETDIQEFTARLHEITKNKIQEVLGVDEEIIIRIHIAKIISREEREKDKKKKDYDKEEPHIPFGGYGRV